MTVSVWFCLCVSVGEYLSGYLGVIVFEWEKMRDSVNECLYIYVGLRDWECGYLHVCYE